MDTIREPFSSGSSPIHNVHPGMRIVCAFLFSVAGAIASNINSGLSILISGILFVILARLDFWLLLRRLLAVNFFIAFLWIFIPFSHEGHGLFKIYGLTATREGVELALIITLKSNGIVLALTSFLATMPVQTLGAGMQCLHLPDSFCRLFSFTYRYVHVIREEYTRLHRAAVMRGFVAGNNLRTYRTYAWLVGMLLVRSFDRAHRVWQAMLCRGFNGRFHTLRKFRLCSADWMLLGFVVCVSLGAVFLDYTRGDFRWMMQF